MLLLLCSTSVAKLLLLRTFSAHSALGLETRPTEMECFLMTREGCNILVEALLVHREQ